MSQSSRRLKPRAVNGHAPPLVRSRRSSQPSILRTSGPGKVFALSQIEPQTPRLVVPLRQCLQVPALRPYSPQSPYPDRFPFDPDDLASLSVASFTPGNTVVSNRLLAPGLRPGSTDMVLASAYAFVCLGRIILFHPSPTNTHALTHSPSCPSRAFSYSLPP